MKKLYYIVFFLTTSIYYHKNKKNQDIYKIIGDLYALIYYYPSIGGAGWDRREVCMEVLKKKLIECDKRIFGTSVEEMYKNCK